MEYRREEILNRSFLLKVLGYYAILAMGVVGVIHSTGIELLMFQVIVAIGIVHGVELQHQAIHSLGFSNRTANYLVGIGLGAPMLVSFSAYQDDHLRHHRLVGTADDKEFFNYGENGTLDLQGFLTMLFMPLHYMKFLDRVRKAIWGWDIKCRNQKASQRMRFEYLLLAAMFTSLISLSICFKSWAVITAWLLPLVLVAGPIHSLIELPEHYGCSRDSKNVFENTRSITSTRLMTWFTNGNNYHVEHHLYPSLPIDSLPILHLEVKDRIVNYNSTYFGFFKNFISDLRYGISRSAI